MSRRLLVVAVLAVALVGTASAARTDSLPSFYGCQGTHASIRPHAILVACGDANYYLAQLHWSSWTAMAAVATGVAHVNDCNPDCAKGRFHAYSNVSVHLSRPESCSNKKRLFTRIEWRYRARKPAGIRRHSRERAPFWPKPHCP